MSKELTFTERVVRRLVLSIKSNRMSNQNVKQILRFPYVDVTPLEEFLEHDNPLIRKHVVKIIVEKGNRDKILELAEKENDKTVLLEMCEQLSKSKEGLEKMVVLLDSYNPLVKETAIKMFRNANREDCLFPLIFDEDDDLVDRIKRYMKEGKDGENSDS